MQHTLDYAKFKNFACAKAYDVIGEGQYKAYLVRCRDNNDAWALQTQADIAVVQEHVKDVNTLVNQLRKHSASGLSAIAKDIMTNTTQPTYLKPSWNVCQISGQHSSDCVEICRSQHQKAPALHVHGQYVTFLNLLWYVSKIEHVVRNVTRKWLAEQPCEVEHNMGDLCQRFAEQDAMLNQLFVAFEYGSSFVRTSLQRYLNLHETLPPLTLGSM
eukprot:525598-Rhodomonas_salina.2